MTTSPLAKTARKPFAASLIAQLRARQINGLVLLAVGLAALVAMPVVSVLGNLVAEMAVGRHAERDVLLAMSQFPESVIQK